MKKRVLGSDDLLPMYKSKPVSKSLSDEDRISKLEKRQKLIVEILDNLIEDLSVGNSELSDRIVRNRSYDVILKELRSAE